MAAPVLLRYAREVVSRSQTASRFRFRLPERRQIASRLRLCLPERRFSGRRSLSREAVWLREITRDDVPCVVSMVKALAEHDGIMSRVQEKDLLQSGFSDDRFIHVLVVEDRSSGSSAGSPLVIGYAVYYFTYSTWEGRVLHVEDLFFKEQYRGRGIGTKLMRKCAQIAVEDNCSRMNWQMMASNSRAAVMYARIGGKCLREWKNFRLMKDMMETFAQGTPQLKGGVAIRKATKEDVPALVSMIKDLAVFEKLPEAVKIGEKEFLTDGFDGSSNKYFYCFVAEDQSQGRIIGYAFYFFIYSSWMGSRGLHLEDVYVEEGYRGQGLGTELMRYCAKVAMDTGCCRMQWQVLDWNMDAIRLYKKLNATQVDDLLDYRMSGEGLQQFASGGD